jgi:hypothetical protein
MDRPLAIALVVLGVAGVLAIVGAVLHGSAAAQEGACRVAADCYVAGVGEAILAARAFIAAAILGVVGLGTFAYAMSRDHASSAAA